MSKTPEEKRLCPRIKTNLKVDISGEASGDSVDLSETGLSFNAAETISSPVISLQIRFPDKKEPALKTKARLVWKRDLEQGSSLYGVEFVELNESQKVALRRELIKTQISGLLDEIKDPQTRKNILHFFLKDILEYLNEMIKFISCLRKDTEQAEEIEREFTHLNNKILLKGYCLEELLENERGMHKVKENFRSLICTWIYKSPIVKRALEKPRRYPGDYLLLETIYDNRPLAKEGVGLCFDKYFLHNPYAVAVRYRKDKLREMLKKEIQESNLETINIFDIACGSCREIREIPLASFRGKTVILNCLDWDEEALEFSRQAVKNFSRNVKFNFIKEDIINIIRDAGRINSFEKQDLVYSIGLIDYLSDRVLKMFVQFFYVLLKEKGKLILTHKNREKTFPLLPPDWFCNWKFVPRDKEEVIHLLYDCGIKNFSLSTQADDFNDIFYFIINKQSGAIGA